jgi:hypothetical protein
MRRYITRSTRILIGVAFAVVLVSGSVTPSWAKEFLLKIGDLQIPAGTAVHGDAIAVGGTAYVEGTVDGNAVALGGDVDVRGHVGGSVRAEGGNVVLHATAVVDGDATAVGGRVQREPGASVGGRGALPSPPPTVPSVPGPPSPGPEVPSPPTPWWLPGLFAGAFLMFKSLFWLFPLFLLAAFVGTAWLLAMLFPRVITRLAALLERDPVMALGAGLLGWPLAAMVAVLLIFSVVGIPLAFLIPVALFAVVQLGTTAVALVVGQRIRRSGPVQEVIVGAVILAVVFSIPGLGGLVALAVATWGLGVVLLLFVEQRRFHQSPPPAQPPSPPQTSGHTAAS